MSTRIQKTITRQKEKIAEGNFYEAHQQLRVIATRYVKTSNWNLAIEVLFEGAQALLHAGQGGSGGDLCLYLVEVYCKAELESSSENKGKIFSLLRAFPVDEPTRRRFIGDAVSWTSKFGDFVQGDPELHHLAGCLYSEDCEPYDAEKHLTLGTRDSPDILARLEYDWYSQNEAYSAPFFAARCVFPYLLTRNLLSANKAYMAFTMRLGTSNPGLLAQNVGSSTTDIKIFPSLPLLNFLGLLLLACQRGNGEALRQIRVHYSQHIRDVSGWNEILDQIGEIWFGIPIAKQGNPLLDMMGSMLFGGSSANSGAGQQSSKGRLTR